jgi:hypothetical protein
MLGAQRTRVKATSRCRQSVSQAPLFWAISLARMYSSRTSPSRSDGWDVIVSRRLSSSTPLFFKRSYARFSTVKRASSKCAEVSFCATLCAMSLASWST